MVNYKLLFWSVSPEVKRNYNQVRREELVQKRIIAKWEKLENNSLIINLVL